MNTKNLKDSLPNNLLNNLPYNPENLSRELKKYYISSSEVEISEMLDFVGKNKLSDLYTDIPKDYFFGDDPEKEQEFTEELEYFKIIEHVQKIADKNNCRLSFIGDTLPHFKIHAIAEQVLKIRNLTTCYTPYQPEKSQGTLIAHWLYQACLYHLTGFEGVNVSLYERSTSLYESIQTSCRITKKKKAIILENIFSNDIEVLKTLSEETNLELICLPFKADEKAQFPLEEIEKALTTNKNEISCVVYPQVNNLGFLEDVDAITDLIHSHGVKALAIIDPILMAEGGLKKPIDFGNNGADIIVGEGQHLALAPNFGGPGLGITGIRYNDDNKQDIRLTSGRYVGVAKDSLDRECRVTILSTREQHIRREKATSNICSNQAFIATLAGACILAKGDEGFKQTANQAKEMANYFYSHIDSIDNFEIAFENGLFFNELTCRIVGKKSNELIDKATEKDIWLGVDVSERIEDENQYLKFSFNDLHDKQSLDKLINFLKENLGEKESSQNSLKEIPQSYLRKDKLNLPKYSIDELISYYRQLGEVNYSPDQSCYPLGSCTMKYNPYINDYLASLNNFQMAHPQAPIKDVQGCLEIIYHNQEIFKKVTGLPYITNQPVSGAQGELVGIKMFQAYHRNNGEKRDIIIIPASAHGTNPATATYAGYGKEGGDSGIKIIASDSNGQIDENNLKELIEKYGKRISGIMITNPNTTGIFEMNFKKTAEMMHDIGALVYMDGANMNAIAGWINLSHIGVDAVHNNTHKTWSIPHGGGGPGDAFVAVSEKLKNFLPGYNVIKEGESYHFQKAKHSIGSFHRNYGNFAHKVRSYTYLKALGSRGIKKMSSVAVLNSKYIEKKVAAYPSLPDTKQPRMHEFIITLSEEQFKKIMNETGLPKAKIIGKVGKLFLDFGLHAPTVSFPEPFGLMVEPTESPSKDELDRLAEIILAIKDLVDNHSQVLLTTPHFTSVRSIDEVQANKQIVITTEISKLPAVYKENLTSAELFQLSIEEIKQKIIDFSNLDQNSDKMFTGT